MPSPKGGGNWRASCSPAAPRKRHSATGGHEGNGVETRRPADIDGKGAALVPGQGIGHGRGLVRPRHMGGTPAAPAGRLRVAQAAAIFHDALSGIHHLTVGAFAEGAGAQVLGPEGVPIVADPAGGAGDDAQPQAFGVKAPHKPLVMGIFDRHPGMADGIDAIADFRRQDQVETGAQADGHSCSSPRPAVSPPGAPILCQLYPWPISRQY